MKTLLRYTHPVTHSTFYFIDFNPNFDHLIPIGCLLDHKQNATVFQTKREALKVLKLLISLDYRDVRTVRYL